MTTRMYPLGRAPRRLDTERVVVQLRQSEVIVANQHAVHRACSRSTFMRNMYLIGLAAYQKQPSKFQLIDVDDHPHTVLIVGQ